jgi:hypothetical protein
MANDFVSKVTNNQIQILKCKEDFEEDKRSLKRTKRTNCARRGRPPKKRTVVSHGLPLKKIKKKKIKMTI